MMFARLLLVATSFFAWHAPAAAQSQYYLFPIGILEGVYKDAENPVLQRSIVQLLQSGPDVTLINRFQDAVRQAFPQSTVHASQVCDAGTGGTYAYTPQYNAPFRVSVKDSYAAVLSVTRASIYRNERAGLVDYQIPVTLTLQIIKPNEGKVAYTLSDTFYSPFTFSKQEDALAATRALINQKVIENMMTQVDFLVKEATKAFNPKASTIKVIGKSGKYYVLDAGYEVGFIKGDQPEAERVDQPGKELFFKVISAASGHAIVRLEQGDLDVGASLKFLFGASADDSQKPGLLPVARFDQFGEQFDDQVAIGQQFVKNLGFSSKFNIIPVNTNFKKTMGIIQSQANCVAWEKYPGSSPAKESRTDLPRFFAQFDLAKSDIYRNEGARGSQGIATETEENFGVATSVRLIDSRMRVHYSETVVEPFKIRRVNNGGQTTRSGLDVAIKNSVLKLSTNFAKNAKLEVRDLVISKVDGNRIWVPASGLNPSDISNFSVLRELDVSYKGQKVQLPLELGEGSEPKVSAEGNELVLTFSRITNDTPLPRKGDKIRFEGLAKPGSINVQRCNLPDYFSDRSAYEPKFTNMFVEAAINASPKLQMIEVSDDFFDMTTKLLDLGNFKSGSIQKSSTPAVCYQAGAAARPDGVKCENGRCSATVVNGLIVRFGPAPIGPSNQQVQAAQQTQVSNILESSQREFLGFNSMLWFDTHQAELKKKLQNFSPK
jgi:hypothetical protein